MPPPPPRPPAALSNLSEAQKAAIRAAVAAATTPAEIDALEQQLKAGVIPGSGPPGPPPDPPPPRRPLLSNRSFSAASMTMIVTAALLGWRARASRSQYDRIFMPCFECYDFEAAVAHEVGAEKSK